MKLSPQTPRLTDSLSGPKDPRICQSCSRGVTDGINVVNWQEHDHNDQPERKLVVLCDACSKRLIEPHPRLYKRHVTHEPYPGAMPLCVACRHRDGVTCNSPLAKFNGGPGLDYVYPQPAVGFWDGYDKVLKKRTGGRMVTYAGPVTACTGREI